MLPGVSDEDWQDIEHTNGHLQHMRDGCVSEVRVEGDLLRSKLAWMCRCLEQSLRYRTVALTDGMINAWATRNPLSASILSRSLLETVALIVDVEDKITRHVTNGDIQSLYEVLYGTSFSTRDEETIKENAIFKSINVLTLIGKMDRRAEGILSYYESVSERVHPNSGGHRGFFASLDLNEVVTKFSSDYRYNGEFFHGIHATYTTVGIADNLLQRMHDLVPIIADMQEFAIEAAHKVAKEMGMEPPLDAKASTQDQA